MGNSQSCCSYASPKQNRKRKEDVYQPARTAEETAEAIRHPSHSNLQHISEREPEDIDGDPSNNPTTSTLFLVRSKTDLSNNKIRRSSHYDNHHHNYDYGSLKKFSSCSTIFIDDSTVSQPNLKNTIKAVALAIYFHIKNRDRNGPTDGRYLDIFDEKLHPLSKEIVPSDYDKRDPEHKAIYRFVRTLFTAAQLTAECAIVTLVYLERLLMYAEIDICPSNWRRIVLGAILLASKVWDDQAVWNVDYCQILKDIQVEDILEIVNDEHGERLHQDIKVMQSSYQGKFNPNMMGDYCWFLQRETNTSHKLKNMSETFLNIWNVPTMNELERQFLELLQFNINVPSSVYAKYYFDLRALADAHDLSFPLEPLSKERALKLEAMSSVCEDKMKMWMKKDLKRSTSLDGLTASQRTSKAILS